MDNLSLTPRRKGRNKTVKEKKKEVVFDPSVAKDGDVSSYFCIFVAPNTKCHNPALRPLQLANIIQNKTLAHTEGT
jgi:hypothetical protein